MKILKKKFVRVIWKDATSTDAWTDAVEITPVLHKIETVGHLQQETEEAIVVALSHDAEGEAYSSFISIPLAWIVSRDELAIKKKRKK